MKNKNIYICLILFLLFISITFFVRYFSLKEPDYNAKANKFINVLHEKEVLLNSLLDSVVNDIKTKKNYIEKTDYYENIYKKNEVAIIVSKDDSILFWSSNSIPVEDIVVDTLYISEIFHLSNGWYEVREKRYENYLIRGAILIKREYRYQNDYISNKFQNDFSTPDDTEIQIFEGEYNVFSSEGYLLCSLVFNKTKKFPVNLEYFSFICFDIFSINEDKIF